MTRIDIIALCTLVAGLGSFASAVIALGVYHNVTVMVILLGLSVAGQTASQLARIYGAPSQTQPTKESQVIVSTVTTEETILQDIGVLDEALNEIVQFEQGQATTLSPITVDGKKFAFTAQKFGTTQPPSTYTVFTGSVFNIIALALLDASEFAAGSPLSLAVKVGSTWYGITIAAVAA